jgi:hypothetical protein
MPAAWLGLTFLDQWDPNDKAWIDECLVIAKSEVRRASARGLPASIDRSDLESVTHEVIARHYQDIRDGALMRLRIRSRLMDYIRATLYSKPCQCECEACAPGACEDCTNPNCRERKCGDKGCDAAFFYVRTFLNPSQGPQIGSPGGGTTGDDGEDAGRGAPHMVVNEGSGLPWEEIKDILSPGEFELLLGVCEGYSEAEIARADGISQQAVSKRLKKIIEKVKQKLSEAPTVSNKYRSFQERLSSYEPP